LPADIGK